MSIKIDMNVINCNEVKFINVIPKFSLNQLREFMGICASSMNFMPLHKYK